MTDKNPEFIISGVIIYLEIRIYEQSKGAKEMNYEKNFKGTTEDGRSMTTFYYYSVNH